LGCKCGPVPDLNLVGRNLFLEQFAVLWAKNPASRAIGSGFRIVENGKKLN